MSVNVDSEITGAEALREHLRIPADYDGTIEVYLVNGRRVLGYGGVSIYAIDGAPQWLVLDEGSNRPTVISWPAVATVSTGG